MSPDTPQRGRSAFLRFSGAFSGVWTGRNLHPHRPTAVERVTGRATYVLLWLSLVLATIHDRLPGHLVVLTAIAAVAAMAPARSRIPPIVIGAFALTRGADYIDDGTWSPVVIWSIVFVLVLRVHREAP